MKAPRLVLCVLLVGVLCSKVQAATHGSNIPRYCCETYSPRPIAWKLVQTFEVTKSSCSLSAVIFTTKRGQKVCADPKAKWTQRYVASLKSQKQLSSPSGAGDPLPEIGLKRLGPRQEERKLVQQVFDSTEAASEVLLLGLKL
ncbi:C-C motif chemokine 26 [Gracilinanus agilis]|uniref:C-C motif chemokine 26 n=1 Tax=Gracilinanus agilis TaxID=191870 RepID=UPI001CFCF667|nr:C-C motif chemokine 26 [Gracilinanus agilis]